MLLFNHKEGVNMSELLAHLLGLLLVGITGTVCLFLCLLNGYKDEVWEILRGEHEDK